MNWIRNLGLIFTCLFASAWVAFCHPAHAATSGNLSSGWAQVSSVSISGAGATVVAIPPGYFDVWVSLQGVACAGYPLAVQWSQDGSSYNTISTNIGNSDASATTGQLYLTGITSAGFAFYGNANHSTGANLWPIYTPYGTTQRVQDLKVQCNSGNFSAGTITVYARN